MTDYMEPNERNVKGLDFAQPMEEKSQRMRMKEIVCLHFLLSFQEGRKQRKTYFKLKRVI